MCPDRIHQLMNRNGWDADGVLHDVRHLFEVSGAPFAVRGPELPAWSGAVRVQGSQGVFQSSALRFSAFWGCPVSRGRGRLSPS